MMATRTGSGSSSQYEYRDRRTNHRPSPPPTAPTRTLPNPPLIIPQKLPDGSPLAPSSILSQHSHRSSRSSRSASPSSENMMAHRNYGRSNMEYDTVDSERERERERDSRERIGTGPASLRDLLSERSKRSAPAYKMLPLTDQASSPSASNWEHALPNGLAASLGLGHDPNQQHYPSPEMTWSPVSSSSIHSPTTMHPDGFAGDRHERDNHQAGYETEKTGGGGGGESWIEYGVTSPILPSSSGSSPRSPAFTYAGPSTNRHGSMDHSISSGSSYPSPNLSVGSVKTAVISSAAIIPRANGGPTRTSNSSSMMQEVTGPESNDPRGTAGRYRARAATVSSTTVSANKAKAAALRQQQQQQEPMPALPVSMKQSTSSSAGLASGPAAPRERQQTDSTYSQNLSSSPRADRAEIGVNGFAPGDSGRHAETVVPAGAAKVSKGETGEEGSQFVVVKAPTKAAAPRKAPSDFGDHPVASPSKLPPQSPLDRPDSNSDTPSQTGSRSLSSHASQASSSISHSNNSRPNTRTRSYSFSSIHSSGASEESMGSLLDDPSSSGAANSIDRSSANKGTGERRAIKSIMGPKMTFVSPAPWDEELGGSNDDRASTTSRDTSVKTSPGGGGGSTKPLTKPVRKGRTKSIIKDSSLDMKDVGLGIPNSAAYYPPPSPSGGSTGSAGSSSSKQRPPLSSANFAAKSKDKAAAALKGLMSRSDSGSIIPSPLPSPSIGSTSAIGDSAMGGGGSGYVTNFKNSSTPNLNRRRNSLRVEVPPPTQFTGVASSSMKGSMSAVPTVLSVSSRDPISANLTSTSSAPGTSTSNTFMNQTSSSNSLASLNPSTPSLPSTSTSAAPPPVPLSPGPISPGPLSPGATNPTTAAGAQGYKLISLEQARERERERVNAAAAAARKAYEVMEEGGIAGGKPSNRPPALKTKKSGFLKLFKGGSNEAGKPRPSEDSILSPTSPGYQNQDPMRSNGQYPPALSVTPSGPQNNQANGDVGHAKLSAGQSGAMSPTSIAFGALPRPDPADRTRQGGQGGLVPSLTLRPISMAFSSAIPQDFLAILEAAEQRSDNEALETFWGGVPAITGNANGTRKTSIDLATPSVMSSSSFATALHSPSAASFATGSSSMFDNDSFSSPSPSPASPFFPPGSGAAQNAPGFPSVGQSLSSLGPAAMPPPTATATNQSNNDAVVAALYEQVARSRKAWRMQLWELEAQVRQLKGEVEQLREEKRLGGFVRKKSLTPEGDDAFEGSVDSHLCQTCGCSCGSSKALDTSSNQSGHSPSIIQRPRPKGSGTGASGALFGHGVDS